jgi:hypothetical protein
MKGKWSRAQWQEMMGLVVCPPEAANWATPMSFGKFSALQTKLGLSQLDCQVRLLVRLRSTRNSPL